MDKVERYKKMFPSDNGVNELSLDSNGKVEIPTWLMMLLIQKSGIKSRKKRILKKVLKKQITKIILQQLENEQDVQN